MVRRGTGERVSAHLDALTRDTNGRPVGSTANHAAEAYIAGVLGEAGYEIEQQSFPCVDWRSEGGEVWLGDGPLPIVVNPFSPPCDVTGLVVRVGSMAELQTAALGGKIALLHGELTEMPLFPRNYPFFTFETHQQIIDLLEAGQPLAVITVAPSNVSPAPVIEDGDFGIPSVTVARDVGAVLADATEPVTVRVRSTSRPGRAANVIARLAHPSREKVVITAHFDTKPGTPGALDNAAGVAAMLSLAELLSGSNPTTNLEIVAFNGEDHYAAPGEVAYINGCGSEFGRIALLINIDGVGLRDAPTTCAFFNCDDDWVGRVRRLIAEHPGMEETEPWPEGDHSIFAMQGVPCIAVTSSGIHALIESVLHTPKDSLDLVDPEKIAAAVEFMAGLLSTIGPPPSRLLPSMG